MIVYAVLYQMGFLDGIYKSKADADKRVIRLERNLGLQGSTDTRVYVKPMKVQ